MRDHFTTPLADPLTPGPVGTDGGAPRFLDRLGQVQTDMRLSKRERTRARILAATVELLAATPTTALTAAGIAEKAGLSRASFYGYFLSADEVLKALLRDFASMDWKPRQRVTDERDTLTRLRQANLAYGRFYLANADIYAVLSQFSPRNPELQASKERIDAELARATVRGLVRDGLAPSDPAERLRLEGVARMLIGMTEETLRQYCTFKDALMQQSFPTIEALCESLTRVWFRALVE